MSLDAYCIGKFLQWLPSAVRACQVSLSRILKYLVAGFALPCSVGGTRTGSVCLGVTFGRVG